MESKTPQEGFNQLREELRALRDEIRRENRDALNQVRSKSDKALKQAKKKGNKAVQGFEHGVEDRPYLSLMIMFLAGILVGKLIDR